MFTCGTFHSDSGFLPRELSCSCPKEEVFYVFWTCVYVLTDLPSSDIMSVECQVSLGRRFFKCH